MSERKYRAMCRFDDDIKQWVFVIFRVQQDPDETVLVVEADHFESETEGKAWCEARMAALEVQQ